MKLIEGARYQREIEQAHKEAEMEKIRRKEAYARWGPGGVLWGVREGSGRGPGGPLRGKGGVGSGS